MFDDFFICAGHNYLVVGDRLSGWSDTLATPAGTVNSGARGLKPCLRKFFATFGLQEELSSYAEFASSLPTSPAHEMLNTEYHPR